MWTLDNFLVNDFFRTFYVSLTGNLTQYKALISLLIKSLWLIKRPINPSEVKVNVKIPPMVDASPRTP